MAKRKMFQVTSDNYPPVNAVRGSDEAEPFVSIVQDGAIISLTFGTLTQLAESLTEMAEQGV